MREGVAGVGVHRRHRRLTGREVVGVTGEDALPIALRRRAQHALRTNAPDLTGEVAPQVECGGEPAVRVGEEREVAHSHRLGRGRLLRPADAGDLGA